MARIPYPDPSRYEGQPLTERIRRERGGQLHNLYRMLLHSPPVTEGWLAFLTAIRHETELPGRYRELAILRIAVLNGAQLYERMQADPRLARVPVIVSTSDPSRAPSGVLIMKKPINLGRLLLAVREHCSVG